MIYALRKLIAFVFLLGIFWFIYQDPGNLGEDWFMQTLGLIVLAFAVFWLVVPWLVVRARIFRRRKQNRARYALWLAEAGGNVVREERRRNDKLPLEEGERVFFHEKGTFYVRPGAGFDEVAHKGKPGDVAFPGYDRLRRRVQRTHCFLTDRRVLFLGKEINFGLPYAGMASVKDTPGGLVFASVREGKKTEVAFTFQNPLIASEVLRRVREGV